MMELIKLSNSKVPALKVNLKSKDLIGSIESAKMQKKQIEKLSGNKVKVLDLTYWTSEKSVNHMVEKAREASFLLMFMQIIVPAFLVVVGLAMIAIWIRR